MSNPLKVLREHKNRPPWIKIPLYNCCKGPQERALEPIAGSLRSPPGPWSVVKGQNLHASLWKSPSPQPSVAETWNLHHSPWDIQRYMGKINPRMQLSFPRRHDAITENFSVFGFCFFVLIPRRNFLSAKACSSFWRLIWSTFLRSCAWFPPTVPPQCSVIRLKNQLFWKGRDVDGRYSKTRLNFKNSSGRSL